MICGIWIGGDYIPCSKVTTYFVSLKRDCYYYGENDPTVYTPIPSWEKSVESFEPMVRVSPVILAFWSE